MRLRRLLIDHLWARDCFGYVDADTFVGECICCRGPVAVRFAGAAARADLLCHWGCSEAAIVEEIRRRDRSVR